MHKNFIPFGIKSTLVNKEITSKLSNEWMFETVICLKSLASTKIDQWLMAWNYLIIQIIYKEDVEFIKR